jgi:hypothetical protein
VFDEANDVLGTSLSKIIRDPDGEHRTASCARRAHGRFDAPADIRCGPQLG